MRRWRSTTSARGTLLVSFVLLVVLGAALFAVTLALRSGDDADDRRHAQVAIPQPPAPPAPPALIVQAAPPPPAPAPADNQVAPPTVATQPPKQQPPGGPAPAV